MGSMIEPKTYEKIQKKKIQKSEKKDREKEIADLKRMKEKRKYRLKMEVT
jgi:hypothetical protein